MANKLFGTKLCAAAFAIFALASCQSENTLLEPAVDNMRDVTLTVTASKGEMTRTNLDLSEDQKNLLLTWNLGDEIQVAEEDGRYAGVLKVTEFADEEHTKAHFEGKVRMLDNDGVHKLSFYYLGTEANYSANKGRQMPDMVYDFASQTNVEVSALSANDLLFDEADVTVSKGNATFTDLYMARQLAYGRFTLLYNDEPLEFGENTVVTINTDAGDLKNGVTVKFPNEITPADGAISLTTSVNDFYVTLVPGSSESKIKFNVTIDGQEYEGYSNAYLIEKNDFYRRAQGLTKGEALPINVKKTDGSDDEHDFSITYYANYGDNESWTDRTTGVGFNLPYTLKDYSSVFPENTYAGHTFLGWITDPESNETPQVANSIISIAYPDGTATLYAKWAETEYDYTLVFEDGEDVQLDSKPITGVDQTSVQISEYSAIAAACLNNDYTFLGWAIKTETKPTAESVIEHVTFTEANRTITLVPVYKLYNWLFKWVDDPADNVGEGFYGAVRNSGYGPTRNLLSVFPCDNTNSTQYYKSNKKEGYTFSHWEYNGNKVTKPSDVVAPVKENEDPIVVLIYAKWKKNNIDYKLTYHQNLNGSTLTIDDTPDPATSADYYDFDVADINNLPVFAQTSKDYEFLGWTINQDGSGELYKAGDTFRVTSDQPTANLYGKWKKKDSSGTIVAPGAKGSGY